MSWAGHRRLVVPRFDVVQIAQNVPRFDVVRTVAGAHCPHSAHYFGSPMPALSMLHLLLRFAPNFKPDALAMIIGRIMCQR